MKLPRTSPSHDDPKWFSEQLASVPADLMAAIAGRGMADAEGRYLHWDDLQHREPPAGLSREQWWLGFRLSRLAQQREVPLRDKQGSYFSFNEPDAIRRNERWVDSFASGQILMPEVGDALTDEISRDKYLIKSLVEEAFTSSRLEGAVTTRQAAREMVNGGRKPRNRSERMMLNNYAAMQFIHRNGNEPLSPAFILELHRIISEDAIDQPEMAGRLRESDDVHVFDGDEEIVHTPPAFSELPGRMKELCSFANTNFDAPDSPLFIHPVVQATILHFMIGYDHPFVDGNGRTARALFYWLMIRRGYWLTEFVSISRIFLQAPARYARAYLLTETDDGDLTYFIDHHLHVARRAFEDLQDYLRRKQRDAVAFARDLAQSAFAGQLNRRQSDLLKSLIEAPARILTMTAYAQESGVSYLTARKDLLELTELGLLLRQGRGRYTQFIAPADLTDKLMARD